MKKAYETADQENDQQIIGSMIRDLEFAVKWLEHGRNPDSYQKGAERSRVYLEDPDILNSIEDRSTGKQAEQTKVNPEE